MEEGSKEQEWLKTAGSKLITMALGAATALMVFYFKTNERLTVIEKHMEGSTEILQKISKLERHPIKTTEQIDQIHKSMALLQESVKEQYKRQDKIYEIIYNLKR